MHHRPMFSPIALCFHPPFPPLPPSFPQIPLPPPPAISAKSVRLRLLLRKHLPPNLQPLLLPSREPLPRVLKRPPQCLPEPRAEDFDSEHCLPVRHAEPRTVAVEGYDAGEDLSWEKISPCHSRCRRYDGKGEMERGDSHRI